jgi:hypothetical protein
MNSSFPETRRIELPWALAISTGVACGVLAAIAALILLSRNGIDLAGIWRALLSTKALQLRSAGAWWMMAASAFLVGALVAGALRRLPWPWIKFRGLRWIAGTILVFGLAEIGHSAGMESKSGIGLHVTASFAALCAATLMALFGAYFATRQ